MSKIRNRDPAASTPVLPETTKGTAARGARTTVAIGQTEDAFEKNPTSPGSSLLASSDPEVGVMPRSNLVGGLVSWVRAEAQTLGTRVYAQLRTNVLTVR